MAWMMNGFFLHLGLNQRVFHALHTTGILWSGMPNSYKKRKERPDAREEKQSASG
jgi:hypothetical protein